MRDGSQQNIATNRTIVFLHFQRQKMRQFLALLVFDPRYQKSKFRAAFLLYLAVIVLGSLPGARAEVGEYATGLVLHTLTYSVITFLLFGGTKGSASHKALKSFLIIAMMGAFDEYVQSFFPYRTASIIDWSVDISAALVTSALLWIIWPKKPGRNSAQNSAQPSADRRMRLPREVRDQTDQ